MRAPQLLYAWVVASAASQVTPPAPGHLDQDGVVGITDFLALLAAWGPCPDPCPPHCFADVNTDCTVGINDMLTLLTNWGGWPWCDVQPRLSSDELNRATHSGAPLYCSPSRQLSDLL